MVRLRHRGLRSLTDGQIESEIARLDGELRRLLTERGVESATMPIAEVTARLEQMERIAA